MENERKTVDIDQAKLYDLATAMGLLCRAFSDWDKDLFEEESHDLRVPTLMVATYLLDRKLGGDFFRVAWVSFLDVAVRRKILPSQEKEVVWPLWDEESLRHPELTPISDICIMLAAWNFAASQDEIPPEDYLGPLFTLSGVIVEGIEKGFCLEEERMKQIYDDQREKLAQSHGGQAEFEEALKKQLSAIHASLEERKKLSLN